MDITTLRRLATGLHRGQTRFPYFKDRYALLLLEYAAAQGTTIPALRRGPYARLLEKPLVRSFLAQRGNKTLHADDVRAFSPTEAFPFRLTAARWPDEATRASWRWQQTSREGYNFVLQLNFPLKHNHRIRHLVGPRLEALNPYGHPAQFGKELTLAWARLDIDVESGEALIEEIQSDWIREVRDLGKDDTYDSRIWKHYDDEWLADIRSHWEEAMLSAAIWYLRSRVWCHRIYFHTYAGGLRMKQMHRDHSKPPRSIYTSLPRRFCFEPTTIAPAFLRREKAKCVSRALADPAVAWQRLTF